MAGNLIYLRRRIKSVKNTQKITRAMKTVSAAKLRRATGDLNKMRPFAEKIAYLLQQAGGAVEEFTHPLLSAREQGKVVLVVVTADKGLCGSFNSRLIKQAEDALRERRAAGETVELVAVGAKAVRYFTKQGEPLKRQFPAIMGRLKYGDAVQLSEQLQEIFLKEDVRSIEFIYTQFLSSSRQRVGEKRLFPAVLQLDKMDNGVPVEYILEPDAATIINTLLPRYIHSMVYRILLESLASEHMARMVAMDLATRNASEMVRTLTLAMNKMRQAAITKELLEIITATEALTK